MSIDTTAVEEIYNVEALKEKRLCYSREIHLGWQL